MPLISLFAVMMARKRRMAWKILARLRSKLLDLHLDFSNLFLQKIDTRTQLKSPYLQYYGVNVAKPVGIYSGKKNLQKKLPQNKLRIFVIETQPVRFLNLF